MPNPDNPPLLAVVLQACLDRNTASVGHALASATTVPLSEATAVLAARCALAASAPEAALLRVTGCDTPNARRVAVDALLALGREQEAEAVYGALVAEDPEAADPALETRFPVAAAAPADEGEPPRGVLRLLRGGGEHDPTDAEADLGPPLPPKTFADVGGLDALKKRVRRRIITPLERPGLFERFRRRAGGGVLLYGPPGCGKTLLARATAGECKATFINVQISDVMDMYVGESERRLKALFDRARAESPTVLFFDEVEALGGRRRYGPGSATSANLVSLFLAEMDGFSGNNDGVLILGATNVPWAVDPAFRRPGRFDRVLFVPPPDRPAREAILDIHLRERPTDAGVQVTRLAKKTGGYSGADLQHVVETAVDLAIEASLETGTEQPITQALLEEALTEVKATTTEWLTTARNYARYANDGGQYDEVLAFLKSHAR